MSTYTNTHDQRGRLQTSTRSQFEKVRLYALTALYNHLRTSELPEERQWAGLVGAIRNADNDDGPLSLLYHSAFIYIMI